MIRRFSKLSTVAALFAGMATVPVLPATAEATSVQAPDVSPEILSAMQRDLGLTAEQAQRRLATEAAAVRLENRLSEELGTAFAGAWMNAEGSQLIVAVTDAASAERVRRAGAVPQLVRHSKEHLERVKEALDRNAMNAGKDIHAWYVDVTTNSVVVLAQDSALALADSFIAGSGAAEGAIRVVPSAEAPRPLYDLRGGDAYYPGNARCSIGFSVSGGFVTAGHCGGVGTNTSGFNGVAQGTVRGSSFPGNDYGWVQVNASWASRPWVNNYANGNVTVAGSQEAGINSSVCRSGSTTGWRCGVIQAKNVTVNYAQGAVYGLTQSNACAEGGDSGGSWISGNQAQGVTSGGSGNCTSGGTTFFQPINEILSVYGLALTTTGGREIVSQWNQKCIDVADANTANGTPVQAWTCNGSGAQRWTFEADGTVRALGKCMDVAWGSTANGALIQLHDCNGSAAQQFVLSGAGDLVNPQANKCVDIKDWNAADGARLQIWECGGSANQKWYLR